MALNDVIASIQNHTRNIYTALEEKNAVISENKNLANVPDSIRSIAGGGIDTSDATASEFDIAEGQTAYVNGEKITGTLPYVTDTAQVGAINYQSYNGLFEGSINADGIISGGMGVQFYDSDIASIIELTPDQIAAGNTVLGIIGTATGGNGNTNIKTFNSIEEMNNSIGNQTGDYALIYNYDKDINNLDFGQHITAWTFPKVVILDTPILKSFSCNSIETDDGDQDFRIHSSGFYGNSASIHFNYSAEGKSNPVHISQVYTSQDGITFTSTGNTDAYVELPGTMSIAIETNGDSNAPYLQIFKNIVYKDSEDRFANLYQYNDTAWQLISLDTSDATATSNDIAQGKVAYVNGREVVGGVETVQDSTTRSSSQIYYDGNELSYQYTFSNQPTLFAKNSKFSTYQSNKSVAGAIGLTADKIVSGNVILGITGTAATGGGIDTSDATAYDWHLPTGVTAYARGEKITGTMPIHSDTRYIYNNAGFINDDFVLYAQTNPNDYTLFGVGVDIGIQIEPENLAATIDLTADKLIQGSTVLGIEGIAATNGIDTSAATATENDLALGKTAYVNGQLIEGTLYDMLEGDWIAWSNIRNTYERGTLTLYSAIDGDMIVRVNSEIGSSITDSEMATLFGVTADKIVSGNTILGVTGTATGGLDTSDATAIDNDILEGKTAYVNGELVTGTLVNRSNRGCGYQGGITIREDGNLFTMQKVVSPAYREIYHNTTVSFTTDVEDVAEAIGLTADKIAQGNTILGIAGSATALGEYAPKYISFQGYTGTDLTSETGALNTSNITDMSEMFKDCSNVTELALNNFDTTKVTDMSNMFSGCNNLEVLDMSSFDVSNVSTATGMFNNIPSDCIVWVKDEATREWVLSIRSDLTNVLVIGEALPSATNPTLTSVSKDYDGSALAITVTGGSGGTIYYRTSEDNSTWTSWTTVIPNRTEIGVTYVQAYVKGDNTHSDTLPTASATITIKEVPKTSIAIPTGKTNLKYTGSAQTGVAAGTGYTLSGTTSATNAGTYTAYATPNLNYIWSDGTSNKKTITWSIAKATPTISINQGWAPDVFVGGSETLGFKPSVNGTWTFSSSSSALSLTSKPTSATAGSYSYLTYKGVSEKSSVTITVTLTPSSTTNYNSVTETYKVSVDGIYPDDLTVVTTGRTTYTPNEIGGSSFKLDGYTFRVDYNNGTSKNVSSSQCTYSYLWSPGKSSVPVTVHYEENGGAATTTVTITINPSA